MKLILLPAFWVVIMLFTLSNVPVQRPQQEAVSKDCIKPLLPDNRALTDSMQRYLRHVGNADIPVIAIQTSGDTIHYFISAFDATYMIKQNPPSAIVTVNSREVLLFLGKGSIAKTAPACYNYILKKYSRLLFIDKINRQEGRPPSYKYQGFTYDPIMGDISITKDGRITTKSANRFPFINHE